MIKTITAVILCALAVSASAVPLPYYHGIQAHGFNMSHRIPIPSNAPLAYISISKPTSYPPTRQSMTAQLPTKATTPTTNSKPGPTQKITPTITNTGLLSKPVLKKPGTRSESLLNKPVSSSKPAVNNQGPPKRRSQAPMPPNSQSITGTRPGSSIPVSKATPRPVSAPSTSNTVSTVSVNPRPNLSLNKRRRDSDSKSSSIRHGSSAVSPATTIKHRPNGTLLKKRPSSSSKLNSKRTSKASTSRADTYYPSPKHTKLSSKKRVPNRIPPKTSPALPTIIVPTLPPHRRLPPQERTRNESSRGSNTRPTVASRSRKRSSAEGPQETMKRSQEKPVLRRSPLKYSSGTSRAPPEPSPMISSEASVGPSQNGRQKCPLLRLGSYLTHLPSYFFGQ